MTHPALASTREELSDLLRSCIGGSGRDDRADRKVALVPTMGALHEGHASLMRLARHYAGDGPVVVSVFVNPLQFGAGEDLDRYPRTLEADMAVCTAEGVDLVFAPSVEEVYPGGEPQVSLDPGSLGTILEGESRPGHFRGVLTVVAKFFGLVRPDVALFGEKDYQQLALIRRMVADLCLGIDVIGAPITREPDGLALSSRNRYLDAGQRREAVALSEALRAAIRAAGSGAAAALAAAHDRLSRAEGVDLDYLVMTRPDLTELPAEVSSGTPARMLVAAQVGATRLIDNMPLIVGRGDASADPVVAAGESVR